MSMACAQVATVTGPVAPEALGRTLMHEHVLIGYPGWEADTAHPGPAARERFRIGVERVQELQALGFTSMLDPCPNDLGRDVELMAKIAQHTGFQIVCATGLYKQAEGGVAYWHFRSRFAPSVDAMAELFEQELREGIGDTGIRAGIIKVATGPHAMSDYERTIFAAAAKAAVATGAPITTHTDLGTVGDRQQQLLTTAGVPAHRIVIGHSCGTSDHAYHLGIARGGSYLGFVTAALSATWAVVQLGINFLEYRTLVEPGIATLIVALFFFSGVQLMFLGLLGEYIGSIHAQVRRRPLVIERETINFEEG
jgi:phosphotriesterase-related protein